MCRSLQWLPGRQDNACLQGVCSVCIEHINYTYVINFVILVRCTLMSPTNVWDFLLLSFLCVYVVENLQFPNCSHIAHHLTSRRPGQEAQGYLVLPSQCPGPDDLPTLPLPSPHLIWISSCPFYFHPVWRSESKTEKLDAERSRTISSVVY